jgi:hypothetical protein
MERVMFDQVLNELVVIAMVFILIPVMIIATVLIITGRRRQNR